MEAVVGGAMGEGSTRSGGDIEGGAFDGKEIRACGGLNIVGAKTTTGE